MQGYDDFVRRLRGRLDTTAANGADIPPHFPQAAVKKWELGLIAVGVFLLLVLGLPIAVDPLTSQDPLVRHVGIGAIGLILGGTLCLAGCFPAFNTLSNRFERSPKCVLRRPFGGTGLRSRR